MLPEETSLATPHNGESHAAAWTQHLQRRVVRLLLQHDETLFRNQFRLFYTGSTLPQEPLWQQYDRYLKLYTLSNDLLNNIMPSIRRSLSLKAEHQRLVEQPPLRGNIDWGRTLERSWNEAPGQPPLEFSTRLRQRSLETRENLLTVAILQRYLKELRLTREEPFLDEELSIQEQRILVSAEEQTERELAAPYARLLAEQAKHVNLDELSQEVATHLPPGNSAYRDLLAWWQRFQNFRLGRSIDLSAFTLNSERDNEKRDAWLYELWIVLEILHLLSDNNLLASQDVQIATDQLQSTFLWQGRRFRLHYNRQLNTASGYESDWQNSPATRPDYAIERAEPLEIRHKGELIWREPPVLLDAKYYLGNLDGDNTHLPIKKLLGDMTLLNAHIGMLLFPQLPEQAGNEEAPRVIQQANKQYNSTGASAQSVHLYQLQPTQSLDDLQERLREILDLAVQHLPERPAPICQGVMLDRDTINASNTLQSSQLVLCPKRHIGPHTFDVVNADTDCLQNARLCHVIDQPILPPFVVRAIDEKQLAQQTAQLRQRGETLLQLAEQNGDEERAELLRTRVINGIAHVTEQYVKQFAKTEDVEEEFERWVFTRHWKHDPSCLTQTNRDSLISGEYIWKAFQRAELPDWAAPAVQFCRTLESELKRRFYDPRRRDFRLQQKFTLGTIPYIYQNLRTEQYNWNLLLQRVKDSGGNDNELEVIAQRMCQEDISRKRNKLAHGENITRLLAAELRTSIIGDGGNPGILLWVVKNVSTR
ncbi:hypothetical protein KSC_039740 [Ktedonobacter sp. SOSP1-52]|uniref:hypothetical protein n=1 Tax=Ktedonobacter sp. SOSP1-52 TaxID=2778366 RepID=UPI00191520ED|nr:hypothetical protein [Ktedonobacter sp. SOSP1-52]GHO65082.1 hypothetical protein KSC_039740 [Ktedonobacter sp. SOSP1-52]